MSEYTQEQLQFALQKAIEAGNAEDVGHIQSMISPQQQQTQQPQTEVTESGPWTAAAKSAVESAPGAVGGTLFSIPAALGAARLAAPVGPFASAGAGAVGGLLGGSLGAKAVDTVTSGLVNNFLSPQAKADLGYSQEQRDYEKTAFPQATTVGEFVPDVLAMGAPYKTLGRGVMNFQANKLWSETSPAQRQAWKTADSWGLKLEPKQVREDSKAMVVGRTDNTRIMNQKIAELTGDSGKPTHLDQAYIDSRFKDLGSKYDTIYNDPNLKIQLEPDAQDSITALFANQIALPTQLKNRMVQGLQSVQQNGFVNGEDFRFIMSELKKVQRSTSDGNTKYIIGDTIDNINKSLALTNPNFKTALDELNPKYRALVTTQEARAKDIIDVNGNVDAHALGKMLKDKTTDPLYQVGFVGEALGVGTHARKPYYKNSQQGQNILLGTPGMISRAARHVNGMGLLEAFRRGGPALETTYSQTTGSKE